MAASLDLRSVSDDNAVVDVPFREFVGSLMSNVRQTKLDKANAVRAVARVLRDSLPRLLNATHYVSVHFLSHFIPHPVLIFCPTGRHMFSLSESYSSKFPSVSISTFACEFLSTALLPFSSNHPTI